MIQYSIKQLERISGIKAHTIRIWEKRYNMFEPHRTKTNIRFYDNEHLKKILNISSLLQAGLKVSKIAALNPVQMGDELIKRHNHFATDKYSLYINKLIPACMEFDQVGFEKIFDTCVLKFGFKETVEHVLYPFFDRIGILWISSKISPAQEHFASNIARRKFFSAIDGITINEFSKKNFMLFLPQHEEHEIGLLYCNYLLLSKGYKTTYLGTKLPYNNIAEVVETCKPTHLVLFFIAQMPARDIQKYIDKLAASFPNQTIVVCGGEMLYKVKAPADNVLLMKSALQFKQHFEL